MHLMSVVFRALCCTLSLQLLSTDYPVQVAVSADDAILHHAQYYIHFLARDTDIMATNDNSDSNDDKHCDDDHKRFISLHKLLTFSRLHKSCEGNVDVLR